LPSAVTCLICWFANSTLLYASPAGVIPYACLDGEAHVLLAFDPQSSRLGYGAFGGGSRGDETVAETAAREMREETRCAFDRPTAEALEASTPSHSAGFYSYVAQVPYIPREDIPKSPCEARVERYDWQWVLLADLLPALDGEVDRPEVPLSPMHQTINLWQGAAESLRQAKRDGILYEGLCD
jgi:8-oxo-dGTP pyrophosphatase MutT (NUDIX family)